MKVSSNDEINSTKVPIRFAVSLEKFSDDYSNYFSGILSQANDVLSDCPRTASRQHLGDQRTAFEEGEAKRLRWFLLPSEAKEMMLRDVGPEVM